MIRGVHPFADRRTAGRALAGAMRKLELQPPVVVLGLPRGGVPVAYEVAVALNAPLDVMVVRKIGMPWQPELAIGAIASGDIVVSEATQVIRWLPFERLVDAERVELRRRERAYRGDSPPLELSGQTVVLVDDGLATGSTMLAAVRAARKAGAASVVVAAPVASNEGSARVAGEADAVVIVNTPSWLSSIGEWYENFDQVQDEEVRELLDQRRGGAAESP
jgi:putative phosphoribosyl transferase